jgi:hypothetical protein
MRPIATRSTKGPTAAPTTLLVKPLSMSRGRDMRPAVEKHAHPKPTLPELIAAAKSAGNDARLRPRASSAAVTAGSGLPPSALWEEAAAEAEGRARVGWAKGMAGIGGCQAARRAAGGKGMGGAARAAARSTHHGVGPRA